MDGPRAGRVDPDRDRARRCARRRRRGGARRDRGHRHHRLHAGAVAPGSRVGSRGGGCGRRPTVRRDRRAPSRGVARSAQRRVGPPRRVARVRARRRRQGGGPRRRRMVRRRPLRVDRRAVTRRGAIVRSGRRTTSASSRSPRRRRGRCSTSDTHRHSGASSRHGQLIRRRPVPRRDQRRPGRAVAAGHRGRRRAGRVR